MIAKIKAMIHGWSRNICENDSTLMIMVHTDDHFINVDYVIPEDVEKDGKRYWGEPRYANGNMYVYDNCSPVKLLKGTSNWRSNKDYATFMRQRVIRDMYNSMEGLEDWLKMIIPVAIVGIVIFGMVMVFG